MKAPSYPLRLAEMTTVQAAAFRETYTVTFALLPTGSTEAHGPHLPLATDVIIGETAALYTAEALRNEGVGALVLPPLSYAVTDFAAGFRGTITLPEATAVAMIRDVLRGALSAGFDATMISNAHLEPAHIGALRAAVQEVQAGGGRVAFPDVTRRRNAARLGEEFQSGACHAGRYETSLVAASDTEAVRWDVAKRLEPNPNSLVTAIQSGLGTFEEAGGPNAYFGWPADATAEEGRELYAEMTQIFLESAREILSGIDHGHHGPVS